jgi:hypothetical protein
MFDTTLATKQNAGELIAIYERNTQRLRTGYDLLIEADTEKSEFFGGPGLARHYSIFTSDKEKALLNLRVSAWRAIVNNLGLYKVMSLTRTRTFDKNCEKGELPEINTKNVYGFLDDVMGNAHEIAMETVREVYTWLRPGASRNNTHKTNEKFARWRLGKKVILTYTVGYAYSSTFLVNYRDEDRLIQLDRVMHLLDGAGIPDGYKSPLIDAINTTSYESGASGETTYFSFRCFYNGNLHLTFKRLDLVERLNAAAGGGNILGDG